MRKRAPRRAILKELHEVAAPFWRRVSNAGLDRFFLARLLKSLLWRFREDRFARVRQGGVVTDKRAELSRVFVDLEAQDEPIDDVEPAPEPIVASWMRGHEAKQDATARQGMALDEFLAHGQAPMDVVIGGPGQGKSTVCRCLLLIHATILLLTCPPELVGADLVPKADAAPLLVLLSLAGVCLDARPRLAARVGLELRED